MEIDFLLRFLGEVDDVPGLAFDIGGYGVLTLSSACCDPLGCKMVVYRSNPNEKGLGLRGTNDFWLLKIRYKL